LDCSIDPNLCRLQLVGTCELMLDPGFYESAPTATYSDVRQLLRPNEKADDVQQQSAAF